MGFGTVLSSGLLPWSADMSTGGSTSNLGSSAGGLSSGRGVSAGTGIIGVTGTLMAGGGGGVFTITVDGAGKLLWCVTILCQIW